MTATTREYAIIQKAWIYGRNLGISSFFLSQSWFGISCRNLRLNSDYIFIKKLNSTEDVKKIIRDAALDVKPEQLMALYNTATRNMTGFFLIDKINSDPTYTFRRNFTPIRLQGGPSSVS